MTRYLLLVLPVVALAACFPKVDPSIAEIPKLATLDDVMHANETLGGKLWGLSGEDSYTDAEWTQLKDLGTRMGALAERSRSFSRGPIYDKHAASMVTNTGALVTAADAKDAKGASTAIDAMKQLCKDCHAATR